MEDYIFLIIAIVLSIFGAINKKKKIAEEVNPFAEKPQRSKNFFLDQLLGEDFLANSPEVPEPVIQEKPVAKKPKLAVNQIPVNRSGLYHEKFISTLPDQKKKQFQPLTTKALEIEPEVENEEYETPDYLGDFSLRKAFVYSEILHPKYLHE
jgi:hypothetical protein